MRKDNKLAMLGMELHTTSTSTMRKVFASNYDEKTVSEAETSIHCEHFGYSVQISVAYAQGESCVGCFAFVFFRL